MELVVGTKFVAFVSEPEDVRQVIVHISQGVRLLIEILEEVILERPQF